MNPMIKILKKQGIKAALPLLLLATACGEGTPTASSDAILAPDSNPTEQATVADTSAFAGLSDMAESALPGNALTETDKSDTVMAQAKNAAFAPVATKVPEPATLTGLAVAALGLGAVKRKRTAA